MAGAETGGRLGNRRGHRRMLLQAVGEVRLADRVKPSRRLATPAGLPAFSEIKAMLWHRGVRGRFGPQRLFPPVAHIMKDDILPNFSEGVIWRGLEAAEDYIPPDDLKLAPRARSPMEPIPPAPPGTGLLGAARAGLPDPHAAPHDRWNPQPPVSLSTAVIAERFGINPSTVQRIKPPSRQRKRRLTRSNRRH
jgi:hypothetical protein